MYGKKQMLNMSRFYISSILAFFIPLILGTIVGYYEPIFGETALNASYGDLNFVRNLSSFELFIFILLRNSFIGLLVMLTGLLIGLPSILILISNGLVIGAIVGWLLNVYSLKVVVSGILPHGIFEIPAIIICGAYGMRIGASVMGKIRRRDDGLISENLLEGLKAFVSKALPLFITAALVESFVTPLIVFSIL